MATPPSVLIADDEPALLDLYSAWLSEVDVTILRATSGAEALARREDADLDVAILDRHMPWTSGDEVLDALGTGTERPRVAFVSAATPDVRILDLELDAYLTKPVSREEFVDLVRSLVRRPALPEPVDRYVAKLSKQAALLDSSSRPVLRADPAYVRLESELSALATRIDDTDLEDPFLRRVLPDGGRCDTACEPTL